jgi:hypothetical protein
MALMLKDLTRFGDERLDASQFRAKAPTSIAAARKFKPLVTENKGFEGAQKWTRKAPESGCVLVIEWVEESQDIKLACS